MSSFARHSIRAPTSLPDTHTTTTQIKHTRAHNPHTTPTTPSTARLALEVKGYKVYVASCHCATLNNWIGAECCLPDTFIQHTEKKPDLLFLWLIFLFPGLCTWARKLFDCGATHERLHASEQGHKTLVLLPELEAYTSASETTSATSPTVLSPQLAAGLSAGRRGRGRSL